MEKDQNHHDEFQYDRYGYVTLKDSDTIGRVCVPEDARGIADTGFLWCEQVTEVFLPESVTEIDWGAFDGCIGLTDLNIPKGVTRIGVCLLSGCSSLTSISIPNSVTCVDEFAFDHTGLTEITIPRSVMTIEPSICTGCAFLTDILVEEGNPVYHSDGNCLIETAGRKLLVGCRNSIIPSDGSVTCISECGFFRCPTLTEITVPDGVICIGDSAFEDCADLADVTLPVGIQYIGGCAFAECPRLTSICYGGTTAQWARVTKDLQSYSVLGVIHCADGDIPL